jgi:hypothetical protein
MTPDEENQTDPAAPYGWTIDPVTKQVRPRKRAGRKRTIDVPEGTLDPQAYIDAQRKRVRTNLDNYYARNPGVRKQYQDRWRAANPGKYSEYNKKSNLKLKRLVMDAYGGCCACCGEDELTFLTIDHINDDGAEHRRQMAEAKNTPWLQAGAATYRWLRDNKFPQGFQVLCANCNCGKQWNGGICPHQVK